MPFVNNWNALGPGAPVIAVLLLLSIVATAIVLLKLWQWRGIRLQPSAAVSNALAALHTADDTASQTTARRLPPATDPFSAALATGLAAGDPVADPTAVREAFERAGAETLDALRYGLRSLEMIGQLAPLIGLFGTVLGMIDAFQALEAARGPVDPAALSGGIWAALVTTAAGLALAIPCVVAHSLLDQRVLRLAQALDALLSRALYPARAELGGPGSPAAPATSQ